MEYSFRKANIDDIPKLNEIHQTWEHYLDIQGDELENSHFFVSITEGNIPPIDAASKDNYYIYVIYYGETIIGFVEMYAGYPNKDDLWIGLFEIDKPYRRQGHGKRIIAEIEKNISDYNCKYLALAVDLKNYRGMKFWTSIGFKEVIRVVGDNDYGIDKFAKISLRKKRSVQND